MSTCESAAACRMSNVERSAVTNDHAHVRVAERLDEVEVEREREVRLAAAAVHHVELAVRALLQDVLNHLEELVHLVVLAAHRGAHAPLAVREADHAQERGRVERGERQLLHAVVRLHLHGAVHLRGARHEHVPLARHAHVEVARRRHEVEIARALLRDDLLEALRRAVRVEVLHAHVALVVHLGLVARLAADQHGAQRDAERFAVAAHGLHELHEAVAQYAGSDLLRQCLVKFKLLHGTY